MYDAVIIGGGPAGLATAYYLENTDRSVLLLEETDYVGGRALTLDVAGERVNMGAMFVYSDTPTHELALELDVPIVPFEPATFGVHYNGETVVTSNNEDLVEHLPLSPESKTALKEFFDWATQEYFDNTVDGQLRPPSDDYSSQTMQHHLDDLPEDVQEILEVAIRGGSVAKPSELSATYALRYFASYLVHEKNNRKVAIEGMQSIPDALAKNLTTTEVRTGTTVKTVRQLDNGRWEVTSTVSGAEGAEEDTTIQASHVVLAIPAPRISEIVDLPDWKVAALDDVKTPGSTVFAVVADVRDAEVPGSSSMDAALQADYDDWACIVTPGLPFDIMLNPRPGRKSGVAQFVAVSNSGGYIPEANDPQSGLLEEWIEQFLRIAPGLRGRVLGATIKSWKHCFSLLTPQRHSALPDLQKPVAGTLHFAGDFSSETAGTHGAYAEARRVASSILAAH